VSPPRAMLVLLLLAPLAAGFSLLRAEDREVASGNERYAAGDYGAALAYYRAARTRGDEPELDFNEGAAAHALAAQREGAERRQLLEEAARAFQRAADGGSGAVAKQARYNLGNTRYRQGRYDDAAQAYKAALRADPSHADARHNLALALRARDQAAAAGVRPEAAPGRAGEGRDEAAARVAPAQPGSEPASAEDAQARAEAARPDARRGLDDGGRARDLGASSPADVERKLDELERLSREVWLERLRRRASEVGEGGAW
jgi:tetratricopeptide (TPR) repeat protein